MKKQTIRSTVFCIAAGLFDLAAILTFAGGNHTSTGAVWLCLGSSFLCLGVTGARKERENEENKDTEEKEEK